MQEGRWQQARREESRRRTPRAGGQERAPRATCREPGWQRARVARHLGSIWILSECDVLGRTKQTED